MQEKARIRYFDWCSALTPEELAKLQQEDPNVGHVADEEVRHVPQLPPDELYPVIIGSDLMYEVSSQKPHSSLLNVTSPACGGSSCIAAEAR